jgi:hypothetical protein
VAAMRTIDGILYLNDGDWVDSCSALVEHHDGRIAVVRHVIGRVARRDSLFLQRPAEAGTNPEQRIAVRRGSGHPTKELKPY